MGTNLTIKILVAILVTSACKYENVNCNYNKNIEILFQFLMQAAFTGLHKLFESSNPAKKNLDKKKFERF